MMVKICLTVFSFVSLASLCTAIGCALSANDFKTPVFVSRENGYYAKTDLLYEKALAKNNYAVILSLFFGGGGYHKQDVHVQYQTMRAWDYED